MHRNPHTRPSSCITNHDPDTASSDRSIPAAARWLIAVHVLSAPGLTAGSPMVFDGVPHGRQWCSVVLIPSIALHLSVEIPGGLCRAAGTRRYAEVKRLDVTSYDILAVCDTRISPFPTSGHVAFCKRAKGYVRRIPL